MDSKTKTTRVALVDDHHVVRRGIRSYLESFKDIQVVGEAPSGEALLEALPGWNADVIIMDLLLPGGMDGIEATRRVRAAFPGIHVVALTAYTDEARVIAAMRAGVTGYVRKDAQPEFLLSVVRAAASGRTMIDPSVSGALVQDLAGCGSGASELSPREREVARLMARGRTNRQIAAELVLGEETIKTHVASILSKLCLSNRAQVAAYAIKQGWISVEDV